MNNDNTNDIEKVKQKIIKIRNRKRQKQNYNYKNVPVLPSIYESELDSKLDIPPPPELSMLYNPYNNGIFDNGLLSEKKEKIGEKAEPGEREKAGEKELKEGERERELKEKSIQNKIQNVFSSIYRYFLPVKEGATDSSPPPLDLTNLSFWQIPCDFLNTKFYDNLIDKCLKALAREKPYHKDPNEDNLKNDREIIQTAFNQMLMIGLAYIMTVNVYYFVKMYKWECARLGYLPGHGMFFGVGDDPNKAKALNVIPEFILRDVRKPVFYCSYIYTVLYPALFSLLSVSRYKRLCFVFIFVFMLCFVFITMKNIGLSVFSFVSSGKINPLVIVAVLCSIFTGIFFTSQMNEDAVIDKALADKDKCDTATVSDAVKKFVSIQNKRRRRKNITFYYSIEELKNSGDKKPDGAIQEYLDQGGTFPAEKQNVATPVATVVATESDGSVGSFVKDTKYYTLAQAGLGKTVITINAIIRVILSMALLPVAQIFVSFFFLYTTSGFGLIINEGGDSFNNVSAHMNDKNGVDEGYSLQEFYDTINNDPLFKWWVNEIFLTSIYTIFAIVKFITIMILPISKIEVKLVEGLIFGVMSAFLIVRCIYKYKYKLLIDSGIDITQINNFFAPAPPPKPVKTTATGV